jgi:hypothetical protein
LVPPKPKLFTATAFPDSGIARVAGCRPHSAKGIAGFGTSACRVGGMRPDSSTSIAFSTPTSPDAASVWPMLLLAEPMGSGAARRPTPRWMARASIGSPAGVPVPCASK